MTWLQDRTETAFVQMSVCVRHCLPPLEMNTNCPLAPGLEMRSWGHVSKNSTACSHEWRAHSTIALVCSTKAWHGQKKSSSGHSHKCQGGVRSSISTGWLNCGPHLRLRPHLDQPTEPSILCLNILQENVTWKQPDTCHDFLCLCWWPSRVFTSMQRQPSTLESSYSSPSMTQKQHLVPPDWSHE